MNKKITIFVSSIILLTLASCGTKLENNSTSNNYAPKTAQEWTVERDKKAAPSSYEDMSTAPFEYRAYNGQDLSNIGKDTVLYFAQASCGTCQKTDADIKAQDELPKWLSILKVDFDTATALKEQYGVTTKHTFVLVNKKGEELAKEVGLATTADIAAFAKQNGGMMKQYDMSNAPSGYKDYDGEDLSTLGKETVLYFSQASCGTCQKTDADIKAQGDLPSDLSILKIDFDNETEINKQYGVTAKHTFVLVDAEGNELAKEMGLMTAVEIIDFANSNSQNDSAAPVVETAVTDETVAVTDETVAVAEEVVVEEPVAATSAWAYKNYTGTLEWESVLFFSASWCPSCVAADKNFAAESELAIDADIVKVDYDSNKDLRDKYGVTSQHTFVLVDTDGNMIKKIAGWSKSSDLKALFN